jgi:hypothetical protein
MAVPAATCFTLFFTFLFFAAALAAADVLGLITSAPGFIFESAGLLNTGVFR